MLSALACCKCASVLYVRADTKERDCCVVVVVVVILRCCAFAFAFEYGEGGGVVLFV